MTIVIGDRLYEGILEWCKANSKDVMEYISTIIEERFMTDKYGDLNELFGVDKTETEKEVKPKRARKKKVEEMKVAVPEQKEVTAENGVEAIEVVNENVPDEKTVVGKKSGDETAGVCEKTNVEAPPKKTIKRTRVLKSSK